MTAETWSQSRDKKGGLGPQKSFADRQYLSAIHRRFRIRNTVVEQLENVAENTDSVMSGNGVRFKISLDAADCCQKCGHLGDHVGTVLVDDREPAGIVYQHAAYHRLGTVDDDLGILQS